MILTEAKIPNSRNKSLLTKTKVAKLNRSMSKYVNPYIKQSVIQSMNQEIHTQIYPYINQ